ncbi:site-specific integrase [uncultured Pseudodesulfovibrio sp.]|uniref:site-specific integrase n=1 Tax=uncultured Pseudodesulfovibrio sp. TaxID=2035858 RepID=UPI0029C690DE|nr:site-specific integrase [uncultured Pseudodesulfovibrio sp.]
MDLRHQAKKLLGKNRRASKLTQYKNAGQVKRLCDSIQEKYGLENIRNLKTKHIFGIFEELKEKGLSPSSLASYATAARTLAAALGKQNIVPRTNKELGITRSGNRLRPVQADMAHSHAITKQLYGKEEWLGLAAEMREQFGLRAKESLLSHETRDGELIVQGSKGGRPRTVKIRSECQRDILERVQAHIEANRKISLIPPDLSLKQGLKKQANLLHRLGATKENASHAHSLRHHYAQQLIQAGLSKQEVSEELGHSREEIVAHYVPK